MIKHTILVLTALFGSAALFAQNDVQQHQISSSPVDEIIFGVSASEQKHSLKTDKSDIVKGSFKESTRRLLSGGDKLWEGGNLAFTMKVDPGKQNYLTVKLWGGDYGETAGRLILFIDGKQVGYYKEGDYDVLNQTDADPLAPGRFVYVTLPLPSMLTNDKTEVDLKIVAFGPIWYYGQNWEQFQKPFTGPSRGIYRAYTHTYARFIPSAKEKQGVRPEQKYRSTDGKEVITKSKELVIARLNKLINNAKNAKTSDKLKSINAELALLEGAYNVKWTPTYHHPAVIDLIIKNGDAIANMWVNKRKEIEGEWSGAGYLGRAVLATWPVIEKRLDEKIKIGDTEITRRQAWVDVMQGSRDYWRTHRRSYTNQSMIVDIGIYSTNKCLQQIAPDKAFSESKALHYLHESAGLEPWLGSDTGGETTGQKDVPMANVQAPYGKNYYLFTKKGLSRELGWVGTYGETNFTFLRDMIAISGDSKLLEQLKKLQLARFPFRYPAFDPDGYSCMKMPSEIDNRTAHYPLSGSAYNQPNIREAWWMEVPALLPNEPAIVGVAQQAIEEGQYYSYIAGRLAKNDPETLGIMNNVEEWEKVNQLPKSSYRLPMTPGQPDFVFSDEENAIVALKQGEEVLFVNFYYRAERAVNRVVRVLDMTPQLTRIATVRSDVEVIASGYTDKRPNWIESTRNNRLVPPGAAIPQAWAGEEMPISKRPDDALSPEYGKWGPFLGRAAFYSLTYGSYIIGLNTTEINTYELSVPEKDGLYIDLVSKKEIAAVNGKVKVNPLTTVVLKRMDKK